MGEAVAKEKQMETNDNSDHQEVFDVDDGNENNFINSVVPVMVAPLSPPEYGTVDAVEIDNSHNINPVLNRLDGINDRISNALNSINNEIRHTFDTPFENTTTDDFENIARNPQEINLRISSVESLSNQVGSNTIDTWMSAEELEEDDDLVMLDRQEVSVGN